MLSTQEDTATQTSISIATPNTKTTTTSGHVDQTCRSHNAVGQQEEETFDSKMPKLSFSGDENDVPGHLSVPHPPMTSNLVPHPHPHPPIPSLHPCLDLDESASHLLSPSVYLSLKRATALGTLSPNWALRLSSINIPNSPIHNYYTPPTSHPTHLEDDVERAPPQTPSLYPPTSPKTARLLHDPLDLPPLPHPQGAGAPSRGARACPSRGPPRIESPHQNDSVRVSRQNERNAIRLETFVAPGHFPQPRASHPQKESIRAKRLVAQQAALYQFTMAKGPNSKLNFR